MSWPGEDERVAQALDGTRTPDDRAVAGLVAVAERVREAGRDPRLDPAPAFRDALRAQLLEQVPRPRGSAEPGPAGERRHSRWPARRSARRDGTLWPGGHGRRRSAAILAATIALSGTTLAASSGALPGDPLYELKRRVQGVEVVLARGDDARGHRHLELARSRVRELDAAAATTGPDESLVAALEDMDRQTRTGVRLLASVAVRKADDAQLAELGTWATEQRGLLAPAAAALPGPARVRAYGSLELLATVLLRISSLRDMLSCDCPTPPMDDLGPVPCTGCGVAAPRDPVVRITATPSLPSTPSVPVPSGTAPATPSAAGPAPAPAVSTTPGPGVPRQQPTPKPVPVPTSAPTPPPAPNPTDSPDVAVPDVPDLQEGLFLGAGLGG